MRQALKLHPDSRCAAVTRIEMEAARPRPGRLLLHYFVTGKIGDVSLPPAAVAMRGHELWQHTCFEAFLRASPGAAYYEFNFAPSMRWAAYRFGGYRHEMTVAQDVGAPRLAARADGDHYEFEAALDLDGMPGLPADAAWRLGASVVIEETSGRKSYWALAHPSGKADFHHADCFVQELPRAP